MTFALLRAAPLLLAALAPLCASQAAGVAEAPKTLDPKASCSSKDCHADFAKKKHVHGPVADNDCKECHSWKDNLHKFTLARKGTALCTSCHDELVVKKEAAKPAPEPKAKEGPKAKEEAMAKKGLTLHEPITEDCVTCHDPHASDVKGILTMSLLELCDSCHDKTVAKATGKDKAILSRHGIATEGKACMTCHAPHISKVPYLLTQKPKTLCLSCHDKPQKRLSAPPGKWGSQLPVPNIAEEITTRKHVHGPVNDDQCAPCHDPHGSAQVSLLARPYPTGFYAPFDPKAYALCFECHEADLATKADTADATEFRNGKRNLHVVHVNKPVKGRSCRACHADHASDQQALVRTSVPFGSGGWAIPIRFAKTATGGACQSGCHEPKAYDRKTPVDYSLPPPPPPKAPEPSAPPGPGPAALPPPPK